MSVRPLPVTIAAILMALFSLMNFPGPWWYAIPGAMEETPMFIYYLGIVLGIVGIVAGVGLWMVKKWGWWATIILSVIINILFNLSGLFMVLSGGLRAAIAVQTVGFIVTLVLVVLPSVRRALATAEQPTRAS